MIILASASPRRQELLRQIGCEFCVVSSCAAEDNRSEVPPDRLVVCNALAKAQAVAKERCGAVVLGADTIVFMEGRVYGKPSDEEDARRMLRSLSGKAHVVYTGIALVRDGEYCTDVEKTTVKFGVLTEAEIVRYVNTGETMDKAGAYAIQGLASVFIEGIEGCYTNVVGLPLYRLTRLAEKAGIELK